MIDSIAFTGGLNSDDDDKFIPKGDYRYAINIRNGLNEKASNGSIENIKGNEEVSFKLRGGQNKCIGAFEDTLNSVTIFFIWNSNAFHAIYEYDWKSSIATELLVSEVLNFDKNSLIIDIDRVGDMLYFNTRNDSPKKVNIAQLKLPRFKKLNYTPIDVVENTDNSNLRLLLFNNGGFPDAGDFVYLILNSGNTNLVNQSVRIINEVAPSIYELDLPQQNFFQLDSINGVFYSQNPFESYPEVFTSQEVETISYAPNFSPIAFYFSDIEKKTNNVKSSLWQFAYKWVYKDGEESSWSPWSQRPLPTSVDSLSLGQVTPTASDNAADNGIAIGVNSGSSQVKFIKIAAREGLNDFFLIETIDKESRAIEPFTDAVYNFYNDEVKEPIDLRDMNQLFNFVPLQAQSQELIEGQRLIYGAVKEGYDNVPIDVEVEAIYRDRVEVANNIVIATPSVSGTNPSDAYSIGAITVNAVANGDTLKFNFSVFHQFQYKFTDAFIAQSSGIVNDSIKTSIINTTGEVVVSIDAADTATTIRQKILQSFANFTNTEIKTIEATFSSIIGNSFTTTLKFNFKRVESILTGDTFEEVAKEIRYTHTTSYSNFVVQKTLKRGANHKFAFAYYDNPNRSGLANYSESFSLNTEFWNTANRLAPAGEKKNGITELQVSIKHKAPAFAKYYQLLYLGNNTIEKNPSTGFSGFIQFNTPTTGVEVLGTRVRIPYPITTIKEYRDAIGADNYVYEFLEGDRIRFIYDFQSTMGDPLTGSNNFFTENVDSRLNLVGEAPSQFLEFYLPEGFMNAETRLEGGNDVVEIYRPKTTSDVEQNLFKEIGVVYPILDGFHVTDGQSQSATTDGVFTVNVGDVYYRFRGQGADFYGEDYHFDDTFTSNFDDTGRANRVDPSFKQVFRPTTVYYSDIFIPETNINGLSRFYDDAFTTYDIEHGSIQKLYARDNDVLVFQELKTGFLLVNESMLFNADGTINGNLRNDNQILSKINYYKGDFGCGKNPEAISIYENECFFIDSNRNKVLNLQQNGLSAISDIKMSVAFRDIFNNRKKLGVPFTVVGQYDHNFMQYHLCFNAVFNDKGIEAKLADPITISYSVPKSRWESYYSFAPEMLSKTNDRIISFSDGNLFLHESNTANYNTFYNVFKQSELDVVINYEPMIVKFWQGVEQQGSAVWPPQLITNNQGQESELNVYDFDIIEGVFYAPFLKDKNSPNTDPLFNGDDLRSNELTLKLVQESTSYQKLSILKVRSEASQFTGQ